MKHLMQAQRWELKYAATEATALAVREFVSGCLELDEYGECQPDLSYPVHSLYLDSEDLRIYWGTINGNKNRYKLRLRFYNDQPDAPVFFEIKRRMNEAILKQRGGVKRTAVEGILAGQCPMEEDLISADLKTLMAVQHFVRLMLDDGATPRAHVAYRREAWISPNDNSLRVTLDRHVQCAPEFSTRFTAQLDSPVSVFGNLVILELKFTGRFPLWFNQLVQRFNLQQRSAAKYADGVALKGEHFFSQRASQGCAQLDGCSARDERLAALPQEDSSLRPAFAL